LRNILSDPGHMTIEQINLNGIDVRIWPANQRVETRGDPTIHYTNFADTDTYHSPLAQCILELAASEQSKKYFRGGCGTKIHFLDQWRCPEADLLTARALALFRHALKCEQATVDLSWANVYRRGDYCMPHSHMRSTASVVYFLEHGDDDPGEPISGRFCIVDPRLGVCCQEHQGYMTTPFLPEATPGTMIIFPSQVVHAVNPYSGERPRITLSWNINEHPLPGSPLPPEAR
jgi:hypothetical protein